jgi:hypothetical protein
MRATTLHLVPFDEEAACPLVDVVVDSPIHGSLLPGTSRSPIFALSRCTLFEDGLAPRFRTKPKGSSLHGSGKRALLT